MQKLPQNNGTPLIQFYTYLLQCNVDSNDTRCPTREHPCASSCGDPVLVVSVLHLTAAPLSHLAGYLFQSSLLVVRFDPCEPLSHSAGHPFQSSLLVVLFDPCEPLFYSTGHLFQSSLLVVRLGGNLSENPQQRPLLGHLFEVTGLNCYIDRNDRSYKTVWVYYLINIKV